MHFVFVGFKIQITSPLHGLLNTQDTKGSESKTTGHEESDGDPLVAEASSELEPDVLTENVASSMSKFHIS